MNARDQNLARGAGLLGSDGERTLTRGAATGTLLPSGTTSWAIDTTVYGWQQDVRQVSDELWNTEQIDRQRAQSNMGRCGYVGCATLALAYTNTCARHDRGDGRPRWIDNDRRAALSLSLIHI